MVVLSRRTKNNPVLIGEPGVGKTAVVEGLAQKIQAGDVPETLKGKQVYSLDLGSMVAGSRYRGDFEERLKKVLKEIKTRGDIVLFIDEIHTIVGAGSADGALGASDMLKPMLARGELQTIGATTTDEYRKYIEKDAALERRFQPIQVHEPTIAETIEILKGLRSRYENHHHVTITDGALQSAAELSSRYIQDRNLPDKAIDLIDEAGARLRIKRLTAPPELKELDEKIAKIAADKDEAIKGQDFEKAAELRDKQEKLEADRKQKEDSVARRRVRRQDGRGRGRDRRGHQLHHRYPGVQADSGRVQETAQHGSRTAQAHHRPGRGGFRPVPLYPPYSRGSEGPEAPVRFVHLRRPHRRRQDRAGQDARRIPVRR